MVPKGWSSVAAAEVCSKISVGIVVKPASLYTDNGAGVRAFRSTNLREGKIRDKDWVYLSKEAHHENAKSELQAGDVLVVRTGAPGIACVVTDKYAGSNCVDIIFARPNQSLVLPEYLSALTNSPVCKRQVFSVQGGLAQKHLNVSAYSKLKFLLPPREEQKSIVNKLLLWDNAIETCSMLIDSSFQQKKALAQQLLTGKRRLPGFSAPWVKAHLGDVFDERSETNRLDLTLLSITSDRGVILQSEVGRKDSSTEDKSKYKRIVPGDIGYNSMRMWQGVSALSGLEGIVSPAYTIVTPRDGIDSKFMAYLFKLPRTVHDFRRYSQGLTSDTWNLKFRQFREVSIRFPEFEEQQAIAKVLATQDEVIAKLELNKANLELEKRALMQQLLTGKRRVKLPTSSTTPAKENAL